MKIRSSGLTAMILAAALIAGPAFGQTGVPASIADHEVNDTTDESPFPAAKAAIDKTLDETRAREDLSMIAQSQQTSNVNNNSVSGTSTTGDIRISDNAFQGVNGMMVVNANSGNNVAMNASINVNIVMSPPRQ